MKALVADDDALIRKMLEHILAGYGQVVSVTDGKQALEAYTGALDGGEPFDLVCLDIKMPELDGHDALQAIRKVEQERQVPIGREVKALMVTNYADVKNVCEAFFHGIATAYVQKPIDRTRLESELVKLGFSKPGEQQGTTME
jgi:two-component system chemotaxis response regulator CheY